MKYYWVAIIPALGLGWLNAVYDHIPGGGRSMASVERECVSKFTGGGFERAQSKAVCSCLVDKASDWRDANPDAEYTREMHTQFGAGCINQVGLRPPRTRARPGVVVPREGPPSDWGGQGFVEDDGAWATE